MRVAVVMPAWNEAEGLPGFITELDEALSPYSPTFIVVDDCSHDATAEAALSLAQGGVSVRVHANEVNLGHGPSTITALNLGLALGSDFIIAVDGDGQFLGRDVRCILDSLLSEGVDVVEGVRTTRNDPLYRQLVSLSTRLLVASRTHIVPADANTPLRAYRSHALASILAAVPSQSATPNLVISVLCRRWRLKLLEVPVRSIPRRGPDPDGSTWGKASRNLPSKRFIKFVLNAAKEWTGTRVPNVPGRGTRGT